MINQLDRVLRQLLIHDLPVRNGEVEIAFDQPKGEWSGRLSRPTLNLFLYDVRENTTLREPEWEIRRNSDGTATRQRKPVRLDLHYMITTWAANPDDEHSLIARTLSVLFRHPYLPPPEDRQKREDRVFWQEMVAQWPEIFRQQPAPIPIRVAQPDLLPNPAEIWSAMDNQLRPAIACVVTLALNPYETETGPLVLTRELHFEQAQTEEREGSIDRFWMVGGAVRSDGSLQNVRLTLVDRGLDIPVQTDGRFIIGNLEQGTYTLNISAEGRLPSQHRLTVPAERYDIEI
ncbi:MAG: hypothetical protein DPW09_21070 [Anaerolineae bacterium]|nr:hypothetical protein [Anaerolineae bacterium]